MSEDDVSKQMPDSVIKDLPKNVPEGSIDYFQSKLHADRVGDATARAYERLVGIGQSGELFMSISEAVGMIYGAGAYFKAIGLKEVGRKFMRGVFSFMGKGVN